MFNKGTLISYSRVLEVNPNTGEIEWEYMGDPPNSFYSSVGSGAQRLPNGNTLICEQTRGRFLEVTPAKEKVWEFINPFRFEDKSPTALRLCNQAYRAYRYGLDYEGLKGRDLNPDRVEWTLREMLLWKERAAQEDRGRRDSSRRIE